MTIIIVGAIGYYLFFMGGISTIKGILGFGNNVNTSDNSNNQVTSTTNSTGNISSNINNNVSGSHGSFQQTTDINGVVTKKSFSFYGSPRYI